MSLATALKGAVCAAGEASKTPIVKARPTVVVEVAADAALQAGHYRHHGSRGAECKVSVSAGQRGAACRNRTDDLLITRRHDSASYSLYQHRCLHRRPHHER
jgi:hypothetical protein